MPPPRAPQAGPSWALVSTNTAAAAPGSASPTAVVRLSQLTRQPGLFPLDVAQLRLLITQSASCRCATNTVLELISLWVVHPHLAASHGISTALPPGVTFIDDGPHTSLVVPHLSQVFDDGARGSTPPGGGAAPAQQRPRKLPTRGCDAWLRMAAAGQIAGVRFPPSGVTPSPQALAAAMGPPRTLQEESELVKPGTVKAALFSVLVRAGTAGMTIADMIAATQAAKLRDWSGVANPRNSVVNCCLHDPTFVRVGEHTYALRCLSAQPAWPPPPPRVSGAPPTAAGGGHRGGDSPHDDGWLQAMCNGLDALPGGPASTTSCDVASATAEVVKCIKVERHARSAVAMLQHRMDVATTSLGHARAAAAAAVEAAALATPSPPQSAPGSVDTWQGRGSGPHVPPLELPAFQGDPADRKAVVAHKRAVEAARVAHADALEAAASAERAAKRAKRTDKPDAPARPTAAQMVEETASAVERGSAEVEALRAQLTEATTALATAERATDAVKRALAAAQATAAQASAATAVSVQQQLVGPAAVADPIDVDELRAKSSAMLPPPPGPQPLDVAWHSGAAEPSAPWGGSMRDIPPPGFWTALNVGGGFEASPIAPPPGDYDPLAV